MKDLETNKIVASILVATLIALLTGKVANGLYHPVKEPKERGYFVEVAEASSDEGGAAAEEEKPIDITALMAAASVEKGQDTFKKCAACHDLNTNKIGPHLAGIVNSNKAAIEGYSYSEALKAKGGKWTYEELFAFLKKPQAFVPGTKMSFAGLKKPEQIADLVKYLETAK